MKGNFWWHMVLSLGAVTIAAGALLGLVNSVTGSAIEESRLQAKADALARILPRFDNNPLADMRVIGLDEDSVNVYPAEAGDVYVGCAVECYAHDGFSGDISLIFGFDSFGVVTGYEVLSHSETPGLGARMQEWFRDSVGRRSVIGSDPASRNMQVVKDGGDIDGITAATITSRAFLGALSRAHAAAIIYN